MIHTQNIPPDFIEEENQLIQSKYHFIKRLRASQIISFADMIGIQIYDRFLWNQLREMCKSLSPLKDENKICEGVYSYEKIYALML